MRYPADFARPRQCLDRAIDAAIAQQRIVGAVVLVARDGQTVYRRAAGLADREAGRPMQGDAIFLLASVTKLIASTAAMVLVERGAVSLEDPVSRWLPGFRPRGPDGREPTITVHHLLTHTAGLGYGMDAAERDGFARRGISSGLDEPGVSLGENLARLAQVPLAFAPGSSWRYSMATDVLGAVIAAASGQSVPAVIEQCVSAPLGMTQTRFGIADPARLAVPYGDGHPVPVRMGPQYAADHAGETVRFVPERLLDPRAYPSAGAGMAGTADEVLLLLETLRRGGAPILRPATVAAMMQDHLRGLAPTYDPGWGFGYGGAVLVDPRQAGTPQSPGTFHWSGAYGHHWFIDPAERLSVVMLTNTTFEGMAGKFTRDVRDAVYAR
jgi:CubicO group peptidase (beta-lactamase class C family)